MNILIELLRRLISDTPKIFKSLRNLQIVLALITGLPYFLMENGVVLPEAIQAIASKVVFYASIVGSVIAQLTVTDPKSVQVKK